VVVGYGVSYKHDLTASMSGRIAGVVSVPDEEAEETEDKQEDSIIYRAEQRLYQELLTLNSIRSNFSDVGFWEPRLYTDGKGRSGFKVTLPDDITRWDAVVYAMNKYLQTGTARKIIRSYKPLMAELNVPQFLTRGDSSVFLGKVLNYTSDSIILGRVRWTGINNELTNDIRFTQYHTDLLPVLVTGTDSVTTRYTFTRDDGYLDGEERTVPVVEQGIERAEGTLSILKNGDDKNVKAAVNEKVTLKILDNQIDIYSREVYDLLHYRYDCNEQLASKLIGLINYKLLMQYEGKSFNFDRDVNRIISRLLKNQNKEFLWSWWDVSANTSYWISAHILCALKCAKDAGYHVEMDIENIARKAEYNFDIRKSFSLSDIDLLNALAGWGVDIRYSKYLPVLDSLITATEHEDSTQNHLHDYTSRYSYLKEKLLLQEIRQMKGLRYQQDSLMKYRKEGMLGDVYFSDEKSSRHWYDDDLAANVVAYRIVRNDSMLRHLLMPMQMHFIDSRKNYGWNTYQSSSLLMNVLPDLLKDGYTKGRTATIQINGKENLTITGFPYSVELMPNEEIHIHKESGLPLYYMQYVNERVTKAKTGVPGFRIRTYFSNNSLQLEAGKPADLIVDVDVDKQSSAENVMIEVPIPGACSYADKRQLNNGVETHREYFRDRTMIFCEKLVPGKYSFVIHLLPRFTGRYYINPSQVSLMYIPVVNANTDMKQVEVRQY
jgi:alpha-2-macroglobulin